MAQQYLSGCQSTLLLVAFFCTAQYSGLNPKSTPEIWISSIIDKHSGLLHRPLVVHEKTNKRASCRAISRARSKVHSSCKEQLHFLKVTSPRSFTKRIVSDYNVFVRHYAHGSKQTTHRSERTTRRTEFVTSQPLTRKFGVTPRKSPGKFLSAVRT